MNPTAEARWPDQFVVVLPGMGALADDPTLRSGLIASLERRRREWFGGA